MKLKKTTTTKTIFFIKPRTNIPSLKSFILHYSIRRNVEKAAQSCTLSWEYVFALETIKHLFFYQSSFPKHRHNFILTYTSELPCFVYKITNKIRNKNNTQMQKMFFRSTQLVFLSEVALKCFSVEKACIFTEKLFINEVALISISRMKHKLFNKFLKKATIKENKIAKE